MTGYQVELELFQGPLDLLLKLIQQQALDITMVSLALVTDQYLAYLAALQERSAANLAEFLDIASRLLIIKSRALLPRPEQPSDQEDDAEEEEDDLVAQLREYKRYKEMAAHLRAIEEAGLRSYPRTAPPPRLERRLAPGEASINDLVAALRKALDAQPLIHPVDEVIPPILVNINECIERILEQAQRHRRVRFSALMRAARHRLEIIITFLALLELIKQKKVRAVQERLFGEIYIEARQPEPAETVPSSP